MDVGQRLKTVLAVNALSLILANLVTCTANAGSLDPHQIIRIGTMKGDGCSMQNFDGVPVIPMDFSLLPWQAIASFPSKNALCAAGMEVYANNDAYIFLVRAPSSHDSYESIIQDSYVIDGRSGVLVSKPASLVTDADDRNLPAPTGGRLAPDEIDRRGKALRDSTEQAFKKLRDDRHLGPCNLKSNDISDVFRQHIPAGTSIHDARAILGAAKIGIPIIQDPRVKTGGCMVAGGGIKTGWLSFMNVDISVSVCPQKAGDPTTDVDHVDASLSCFMP